jgi:hypothetical protein
MIEVDRATRADGTVLTGDQAKEYRTGLLNTHNDPEMFMRTSVEAPLGCLRWLNNDNEIIPAGGSVDYELTYDEFGRVYPALALRNSDGEVVGAVPFAADGLLDLGQWALQMAFSKLELTGMGVGAVTGRAVLLEQVNALIDGLVGMAPEVLTERIAEKAVSVIEKEVERGIQARLEANNTVLINSMQRKHALEVLELAKIAARRNEESREESLGSPVIEKMIVNAKELLDDNSVSTTLSLLTR